ncbi:MAG: bifunctional UDP-N-acetylglucosamine diphosphorylase/glucosamine-1-phosphate N-acetyltransferase GlmU, partial [Clostridia bacterium]|nr:bifunctional UDP-N-acetylglucosamine diphosphorylase/glucosamine-1-phosphate N-acetyltransferase GlmU [Clostridia bacterium]
MPKTAAVILAAGKGTRMHSELPKVLHRVAGKCLVQHVLDAVGEAGVVQKIVVIGHGGEQVQQLVGDSVSYAWQKEQLGTGHAVLQAMPHVAGDVERVLILCGDTPLLTGQSLKRLLRHFDETGVKGAVLTACLDRPDGYGRVVKDEEGLVLKIVEQGDAQPAELEIKEVNSGVYCFARKELEEALKILQPDNVQGEYYLTDVVSVFRRQGLPVSSCLTGEEDIYGINTRLELARAEGIFRRRINEKLMENGVTIIDPASSYIEAEVEIAPDTVIHPLTVIQGKTKIGSNCQVGPNVVMVDSVLGDGVKVWQSVLEAAVVGKGSRIGPFSYLRPGTVLGEEVKVGDFVELKNSFVGNNSKVPHLTYIGDASIGKNVNIGAGTITCNYDGKRKWRTVIEDDAFIGSNSNLVAPLTIGEGAYVAAGSTLTKDLPEKSLGIARG